MTVFDSLHREMFVLLQTVVDEDSGLTVVKDIRAFMERVGCPTHYGRHCRLVAGHDGLCDYERRGAWNDMLASFQETVTPDASTITCKCGESFTWTAYDKRLRPWVERHYPHVCGSPVPPSECPSCHEHAVVPDGDGTFTCGVCALDIHGPWHAKTT